MDRIAGAVPCHRALKVAAESADDGRERAGEVVHHTIPQPTGGTMGRIFRHRAGRRMFVGVLALAGLALVACEPLKQPPEPPPAAELPQICIPNPTNTGDPRAQAEPAPTDPGCTPICLPGQEPPTDPNTKLADPGP